MDHSATLTPSPPAAPGHPAIMSLTVRNGGPIVERYDIRALGDAAGWVEPPQPVMVYPGQEHHVVLTFHVPERAPAGEVPVGVLITAQEARTQLTEETTLVVTPTFGIDASLVPTLSHGRGRGVHSLAVLNQGNCTVAVACQGSGDDVAVHLARSEVTVEGVQPGGGARPGQPRPPAVAEEGGTVALHGGGHQRPR